MGARKLSDSQLLVNKLTREGIPFRMTTAIDGAVTIEVLTITPAAKPVADVKQEISRRISEIHSSKVRAGGHR